MTEIALSAALADRYRIERELGQGGMATVYLAHDLKHDRKVAIKVLRPELAAVIGAERFLREIKTIAHLQHPHILGLIDSGEVSGTAYYVMPFVEGESLRDRLNHEKQLSIRDAVRIATEVAAALDYAHRHGVIHRDIKPENVMLHDGSALVTDFGIALAVSSAGGSRMTETGMSLGTPHYMSPEQAMGEREITARSDIYALGVVTYEMLVGEPPFGGATAQAIVARVLTEEPRSLVSQRKSIPYEVESAVFTSLEKLPADRFDSAAEFALALGGQADRRTGGRSHRVTSAVPPSRRPALVLGAVALVGLGFFLGTRMSRGSDVPLVFGTAAKVTWDSELEVLPAISPDGKSVAYAAGVILMTRVMVRPVSGGRSIALTDDTTDIQSHPRWSPDGSRVLFLSRGGVWSAPASGGPARPEVPATRVGPVVTADWSPDGRSIAYLAGDSLYIRDEQSQSRSLAGLLDSHDCRWSPRADLIACTSGNALSLQIGLVFGNISPSTVVLVGVSDGRVQAITDSTSLNQSPTWSPDGRVLYFISNRHGPRDIYAQRLSGNQLDGATFRLTTGLNAQTIALAATGRQLVYTSLQSESNVWSIAIPARLPATEDDAVRLTEGAQLIESASLSPDGQWLLYDSDLGGNMDLYRKRLPDGAPERLTTDSADDFFPDLSPDGRETAFHSWRGGGSRDIYVMPLDGGPIQQITRTPAQESSPRWSPDGQALVYSPFGVGRGGIWVVQRKDGRWQAPIQRLDWGFQATWSQDGKRLVFGSSLLAGSIWIMPADSGAPRLLADTVGPNAVIGELPSWSDDGRTIYVRSRARDRWFIWALPLDGRPPQHAVEFDRRNGSTFRGSWNLRRGRIVYSAEELRSDVWVMEVQNND